MAVDASTDGSAADGEFFKGIDGFMGAFDGFEGLGIVAGEFLAEGEGGGVHEVGSADFDDIHPRLGFLVKVFGHVFEGREEILFKAKGDADMEGGGHGIIGGLAHIDVIVGVDGVFRADGFIAELADAVGDDLVSVSV